MAYKQGQRLVHKGTGLAGQVISTHSSTTQIATRAGTIIDNHSAFSRGKGHFTGFAYFLMLLVAVGLAGLALGLLS